MSRKIKVLITNLVLIGMTLISGCASDKNDVNQVNSNGSGVEAADSKKEAIKYKDGEYEINTKTLSEGFTCKAKVTIKNNKIANVDWNIYDSKNRVFDGTYEDVYSEALYKQQCRDDFKGSQGYTSKLIEVQDTEKVDAVTGATWTNNIFKNAVDLALEKARM